MQVGCCWCLTVITLISVGLTTTSWPKQRLWEEPITYQYLHCERCERGLIMLSCSLCCWCSGPDSLFLFESSGTRDVLLWVFFFCSFIIMICTKGGRTGERVPTRGAPSWEFYLGLTVALWRSHERKLTANLKVCFCFGSLSSLYWTFEAANLTLKSPSPSSNNIFVKTMSRKSRGLVVVTLTWQYTFLQHMVTVQDFTYDSL